MLLSQISYSLSYYFSNEHMEQSAVKFMRLASQQSTEVLRSVAPTLRLSQ